MDNCCHCGLSDESPGYRGTFNLPDGRKMCVGCYENYVAELELALELACADIADEYNREGLAEDYINKSIEHFKAQAKAKIKEQSK